MTDNKKPEPPPLDAERERLRAQGYNDAEISQILVARALGGGAGLGSPSPHPQGAFSNVVSSIVAVAGYAGGLFTSVRADIATILDRSAAAGARGGAFAAVAIKAVVIGVLAFAAWQEWEQHIVSAPKTAASTVDLTAAQATKAKEDAKVAPQVAAGQAAQAKKAEEDAKVAAEVARGNAADARIKEAQAQYAEELAAGQKAQSCTQRMEMLTKTLSINDMLNGVGMDEYNRDCNPKFAGCTEDFNALIATIKVPLDAIKHFSEHTKEIDDKLTAYKRKCGWHENDRDAAIEAYRSIGVNLEPPSPQPTETTAAREPEPSPTPTPTPSYSALATPEPTSTPLRTPAHFDCEHGKHMGSDYVICASPKLLDTEAKLEDAYQAWNPSNNANRRKEQFDWIKSFGVSCGLPLHGRPRDDQITCNCSGESRRV